MKKELPKIQVELTGVDHVLNGTAIIIALAISGYLATRWSMLPAEVPSRFSAIGEVIEYGPKIELLLLPAVIIAQNILTLVIQRFPHKMNYIVLLTEQNAEIQYTLAIRMMQWFALIITVGLAILEYDMICAVDGRIGTNMFVFMVLFLGSLFGTMGYYGWMSWKNK